jgi:molecular chaperone DnaK (HSP70)
VLSANKDTPVNIEGLADNEDFKTKIERTTFEHVA